MDPGGLKDVLAKRLCKYLPGALVVADEGWGDLLAHSIGIDFLMALGAVGIVGIHDVDSTSLMESLAALTPGRTAYGHVIILCSRLVLDMEGDIIDVLRAIQRIGQGEQPGQVQLPELPEVRGGQKVILATNISEAAHGDADPEAYTEGFRGIHTRLVALTEDIVGVSLLEVMHVDVPCMVFGKNAFAFPSHSGASFLDLRRASASCGYAGGAAGMRQIEQDLQGKIALNAHLLSSVSRIMDVQPEAFCIGPLSERVGNMLAFIPAHDSTRNARAAFCIVDRALDTATPSGHSGYFLQQMLCDGSEEPLHVDENVDALRPSMFHPGDVSTSSGYMEFLTSKTQREATLFVRKWLREAIRQSSLKFTGRLKTGAISAEDIQTLCEVLRNDPTARRRYSSLLQISEIACRCLRKGTIWDERAKAEEIARLNAEDGAASLSGLILDELDASRRGLIPISDVLRHLIIGSYWMKMAGAALGPPLLDAERLDADPHGGATSSGRHTATLDEAHRAAISEALAVASKERRGLEDLPWIPSNAPEDLDLLEVSRNAIETICCLPAHPGVSRVVDDILHQRHVPTMKHIGTSIAGLLKSGLGRIGLQHHSPGEYETIVIFVLGGISATEMAEIRAIVDLSGTKARVVVGGSSVCAEPSAVLRSIFVE